MTMSSSNSIKDYLNLETIPYLILIVASIVAIVDIFFIDFINSDYMGLLILLVTSVIPFLIIEKVQIRKFIHNSINEFKTKVEADIVGLKTPFLQQRDDWDIRDLYIGYNELWISTLTYYATISSKIDVIKAAWENGTKIKLIILHPESPNFSLFTEGLSQYSVEEMKDHSTYTISNLDEYIKASSKGGIVEIRTYPNELVPFYSSFCMNPPSGKIKIEMFVEGTLGRRPSFFLTPDDVPWYEHFIADFDSLWAKSHPL